MLPQWKKICNFVKELLCLFVCLRVCVSVCLRVCVFVGLAAACFILIAFSLAAAAWEDYNRTLKRVDPVMKFSSSLCILSALLFSIPPFHCLLHFKFFSFLSLPLTLSTTACSTFSSLFPILIVTLYCSIICLSLSSWTIKWLPNATTNSTVQFHAWPIKNLWL